MTCGIVLQGEGGSSGALETLEGIKYPHPEGGFAGIHPSERMPQPRGRMDGRGAPPPSRGGALEDMGAMHRPGGRSMFLDEEAMVSACWPANAHL